VNLQLIGRAGEDLRLLALAASIRERLGGSPP
jgi:Asp-tRNA(Asn)/Glu-tRNA(Gln) amidotransferase A subunit family amidase